MDRNTAKKKCLLPVSGRGPAASVGQDIAESGAAGKNDCRLFAAQKQMPASGSPIILQRRQFFSATLSDSQFSVHPQPDLRRDVRTGGYHGQPQFSTVRLRRNEVCRTRYCSTNLKKPAFFTLAKPGCSYPTVSACFPGTAAGKKIPAAAPAPKPLLMPAGRETRP